MIRTAISDPLFVSGESCDRRTIRDRSTGRVFYIQPEGLSFTRYGASGKRTWVLKTVVLPQNKPRRFPLENIELIDDRPVFGYE